jgi:adenylate kinase family enzyme
MKKIIWFLGSNATGKTTQAKLLHESFKSAGKIQYQFQEGQEKIKYTTFGKSIGHVGLVGDNQCTGTDTINSKAAMEISLIYCLNECDIVIVDGIMATATWVDIFTQFPKTVQVFVVLLQFSTLEENLQRIILRRFDKVLSQHPPDSIDQELMDELEGALIDEFNEKTLLNVNSKYKGFKTMFDKVKDRCSDSIEIDASQDANQIHKEILNFLK